MNWFRICGLFSIRLRVKISAALWAHMATVVVIPGVVYNVDSRLTQMKAP